MESSKQEAVSAPFKGCITQILLAHAIQKHDAALEQSFASLKCDHGRQMSKQTPFLFARSRECALRDVICILHGYLSSAVSSNQSLIMGK